MPNSGVFITTIDKRVYLFPVCSGTLGIISIIMQIVAVSTSYWAHFKRERNIDTLAGENADPLYEEGHYGLWRVCLTVLDGQQLEGEDCNTNIAHFHPSSWRVFAGIIATICVVLLFLFLATIPFQMKHLQNGRPVYCKYRTLSRIKIVLNMVGIACAVMAAVLFGVNTHHKHYKEPKGWSFGLQIVVIVNQVFLLISSSAENVAAIKIDNASPEPQYLFTTPGKKKDVPHEDKTETFKFPHNAATVNIPFTRNSKNSDENSSSINILNISMSEEFSRDNPIFIDSDNEIENANSITELNTTNTATSKRLQQNSVPSDNLNVRFTNSGSTFGRFRVQKIADMYTTAKKRNDLDRASSSHAFENQDQRQNAAIF